MLQTFPVRLTNGGHHCSGLRQESMVEGGCIHNPFRDTGDRTHRRRFGPIRLYLLWRHTQYIYMYVLDKDKKITYIYAAYKKKKKNEFTG